MAWLYLLGAGLLEIVWAYTMKLSEGFSRPLESAVTVGAMVVSFSLLAASMKSIPLGTGYAIWTGIGAVGTFAVGIVMLGETVTITRIAAAALIVTGIVLMKVSSGQ